MLFLNNLGLLMINNHFNGTFNLFCHSIMISHGLYGFITELPLNLKACVIEGWAVRQAKLSAETSEPRVVKDFYDTGSIIWILSINNYIGRTALPWCLRLLRKKSHIWIVWGEINTFCVIQCICLDLREPHSIKK